ncbi:hypothetical protein AAVH_13854 [Aphelenchoides avenae]|nr:hypothetical protein AAVH_13854 [Aphelenchus avenae]
MAMKEMQKHRVREQANATCTRQLALAEQAYREQLDSIEQMHIHKNLRDLRECKESKSEIGCGRI